MKGKFVFKLTCKITKFIVCVIIMVNIKVIAAWLSSKWPAMFALTYPIFIVCLLSAIECVMNVIHYIKVVKEYGLSVEVEDTFNFNDGSSTEEGMFRKDGSLTFRGMNAFNDMFHQRDMYNRTSTHKYLDKK